jgi:hypothetical protein
MNKGNPLSWMGATIYNLNFRVGQHSIAKPLYYCPIQVGEDHFNAKTQRRKGASV